MNEELKAMFDCLSAGKGAYLPSKFWEKLNTKNLGQLDDGGIGNFKRTIAQNYFTWVVGILDPQFRYLVRKMKTTDWPRLLKGVFTIDRSSSIPACGKSNWRFSRGCCGPWPNGQTPLD